MSLNTPSENHFQETSQEISKLSESQQRILERVISIIEKDENLNKQLSDAFKEKTRDLLSDPDKFRALTWLIDAKMQIALSKVENQFKIDWDNTKALTESVSIIQKATKEKTWALRFTIG